MGKGSMDKNVIFGAAALIGLTIYGYARMLLSGRDERKIKTLLPSASVIDVRTGEEYRGGHFPGAVNIPLEKLSRSVKRLGSRNTPIILYCASGVRSRRAARLIRAMGYSRVFVGGTLARLEKLST